MTTDERIDEVSDECSYQEGASLQNTQWLISELRRAREALREIEERAKGMNMGYFVAIARRGLGEE